MTEQAENNQQLNYGFEDDNVESGGGLQFGLNSGVVFLTKFEFNPNGGSDGTEQEALDIVFNVDGRDISYRQFPVTKAFDKNRNEITDPRNPLMAKAMKEFNAIIVHVLGAFVPKEGIQSALQNPTSNFQQFCNICKGILPENFDKIPLDLFAQWQWNIVEDNNRTFLRIPKNMKHGKWLCKHIPPAGGEWKETRPNGGLAYEDSAGNKHLFTRTKWFMTSNFAQMQEEEDLSGVEVQTDTQQPGSQQGTDNPNWK